ncbi:putative cytosolic protein [Geobacillus sp. WSUCF1]|nr:putative cytosolic protein [Geobacillus sp. WSUCF1]
MVVSKRKLELQLGCGPCFSLVFERVAHRLAGGGSGGAEQLMAGDVICYDFQGDGRFDHSTIVVAKDQNGMPLVNAHTTNSRMRYWSYEDSSAYTPNIRYKFFHIIDRK